MALAVVRERTFRHVCQIGFQQRLWSILERPVPCFLERGFATHGVSDASSRMGLVKFYKTVGVRPAGSGYEVTLDRYSLKSPAKKPLILPTLQLAKAIAAEWDHQGSRIDANTMPLMSLASTAIDQPQAKNYVADAIVSYLPSDPVLCRVEESEGALHQKQIDLLDPVLEFVRNHLGVSLEPSSSIFGANVDEDDSNRVKNYILGLDAWKCSALEQLAGACKSVCIAIAGVEGRLSLHQVIDISRIEESHQIEEWGLVEGGHDIDIAELSVRISAPLVFLDMLE